MESMTNQEQNVKQKAFWSGKGGDVWVERQRELGITLKPLGDAALKKIDLSNCSKILILDAALAEQHLILPESM